MIIDPVNVNNWSHQVDKIFKIKNQSLKEHICNYLQFRGYSHYMELSNTKNTMVYEFFKDVKNIKNRILQGIKLDIVSTVYNPTTGNEEYKLSDGTYISINDPDYEIPFTELIRIFGMGYLEKCDPDFKLKIRDIKIDDILWQN